MNGRGTAGEGFFKDFRRFFVRGLAAVLPTLFTVVILVKGYQFTDQYLGRHINSGIRWVYAATTAYFELPDTQHGVVWKDRLRRNLDELESKWEARWYLNLLGIGCAIILFYLLGYFLASIIGRATWRLLEAPFLRFPVVKAIYPHIKTVTNFLFSERRLDYSRVVAVEYPRKGIWSLGLVTGSGFQSVTEATGRKYISIFVPSSPTPITGYVITVPREEVVDLPFTIDEALMFTVSGGVIQAGSSPAEVIREGPVVLPESVVNPPART